MIGFYLFTACSLKLLCFFLFKFKFVHINTHTRLRTLTGTDGQASQERKRERCKRNYIFFYFYGCCNLIYVNKSTGEMVCIFFYRFRTKGAHIECIINASTYEKKKYQFGFFSVGRAMTNKKKATEPIFILLITILCVMILKSLSGKSGKIFKNTHRIME